MFKALRKQRLLTQKELAKRLGIDQTTISKWENGEAKPRFETMQKIADELDCDFATVAECFISKKGA